MFIENRMDKCTVVYSYNCMANSKADERTNTKPKHVAKSFTNIVFIIESRYKKYICILWFLYIKFKGRWKEPMAIEVSKVVNFGKC